MYIRLCDQYITKKMNLRERLYDIMRENVCVATKQLFKINFNRLRRIALSLPSSQAALLGHFSLRVI